MFEAWPSSGREASVLLQAQMMHKRYSGEVCGASGRDLNISQEDTAQSFHTAGALCAQSHEDQTGNLSSRQSLHLRNVVCAILECQHHTCRNDGFVCVVGSNINFESSLLALLGKCRHAAQYQLHYRHQSHHNRGLNTSNSTTDV